VNISQPKAGKWEIRKIIIIIIIIAVRIAELKNAHIPLFYPFK